MRVLQLIDSLRSGGAERMAVNYANALNKRGKNSYLCCTRFEGQLRTKISPDVGYIFLRKKSTADITALIRLQKYVREKKIDLIHAHGPSWFFAILVKFSTPNIKVVWHDHWGNRALNKKGPGILRTASRFFDGIITVNEDLENWAKKHLCSKRTEFWPNFPEPSSLSYGFKNLLKGKKDFKIIQIANLKPPKDHLTSLKAFNFIREDYPETTLHLIGKDYHDGYSRQLKEFVEDMALTNRVYFYGEVENVEGFIQEADMGILSSTSEGLPLALLEYGLGGLPVVCTNVGQCERVVSGSGTVVEAGNPVALAAGIRSYLREEEKRNSDAVALQKKVVQEYSEDAVIPGAINFFHKVVQNKV